ncbi:MAG: hypothetical protein CSA70_06725 [Rhodobacterales bacterium]|nr:MAG: hypothetical protein CSA70_06725 [Rhodobacterales bacterium]
MLARFIGTLTLVLFGCGAAVIAGADIGLTGISFAFGLALMVIHLIGVNVTGVSVNPALFVGPEAMGLLWLFILVPIPGGLATGVLFRSGVLDSA